MLIIVIVIFLPLPVCFNNKTLFHCNTVTGLRDEAKDNLCRSEPTWLSAVVSDEAGHVYVLVVDTQVLHAAHKLPVANRKVFWEFGDASEEQRAGQIQRSENTEPRVFCSALTSSTLMKNSTQREFCSVIFPPGDQNRKKGINIPIKGKKSKA